MGSMSEWAYTTTVFVQNLNDTDEWGNANYGEEFTVKGAFSIGGDMAVSADGEEFVVSAILYTSDPRIKPRARIRIDGGEWQEVRNVHMFDNSSVGDTPDYKVVT